MCTVECPCTPLEKAGEREVNFDWREHVTAEGAREKRPTLLEAVSIVATEVRAGGK